jgi:hypothetical protein
VLFRSIHGPLGNPLTDEVRRAGLTVRNDGAWGLGAHVYLEGESLRCILAAVVGDVAHFANVRPGHVLGTLSADEAVLFARLCDEYVAEQIPAEVDEATGHVVLRFPSLAATAA